MYITSENILQDLIQNLSALPGVGSIGLSGSKNPPPNPGEGDIDIFIYCDDIPSPDARQTLLDDMKHHLRGSRVGALEKGHWGLGDFTSINGIETWLMYFTTQEAAAELDAVLSGLYPEKLDNYYYPVGRCAMYKNMTILYDKTGFLRSIKERLSVYPEKLASVLIEHHIGMLSDTEDMERAVARKDALFYHFALDLALDHFLQALFAMNRKYFPSRKRTLCYIDGFKTKPAECGKRLLEIIRTGGNPEEMAKSYSLWQDLTDELKHLSTLC